MKQRLLRFMIYLSAFLTFASLFLIIAFIFIQGLPSLRWDLFSWQYTAENVSLMPAIVTTVIVVVLSLVIVTPIGVFTGFYLVEYAKRESKWVEIIRLAADTLAGIPSIVYGLFGMLFFVIFLGFQYSILAGVFTSAIMVLPIIIRSTEEGLLGVPDSLRQASFGLGAGKLRTIFKVVLPVAMPSILSGIILSVGRIIGETAALMYTLGTAANMPNGIFSSSRTLALHMYVLSSEGLHVPEAFATGVVLIVLVMVINLLTTRISKRIVRGEG
ncbi:phosphate ABC transporter membrane protein 2, PhoT family [Granulicatella balaenopterae]|uniref:Phosphate transport system permease protein PstA n=1 Tax=Granulicatella balaenopterae TaxID=137733 RepID=A0A1H9M208_9LACT|nr:phosphate ABC transporter permease PstA [Granulicatella balaenopterae]SER17569.1 phosphate ABC transporter membrane protein 2, PhoT family [Granulicatella balaenopterae]